MLSLPPAPPRSTYQRAPRPAPRACPGRRLQPPPPPRCGGAAAGRGAGGRSWPRPRSPPAAQPHSSGESIHALLILNAGGVLRSGECARPREAPHHAAAHLVDLPAAVQRAPQRRRLAMRLRFPGAGVEHAHKGVVPGHAVQPEVRVGRRRRGVLHRPRRTKKAWRCSKRVHHRLQGIFFQKLTWNWGGRKRLTV